MKKKIYFLSAGFSLLFITLLAAAFFFSYNKNKRSGVLEISVIIRGQQNGYWTSIKQGIDKAAYDMNVDVSFVTLLSENDAGEQLAAAKRELDNEARAIVVAPVELGIFEDIKALDSKVILVGLETSPSNAFGKNTSEKPFAILAPDIFPIRFVYVRNREMGYEIGVAVARNYKDGEKLVLVRTVPVDASALEREEGFLDALREYGIPVEYWDIDAASTSRVEQIKSKIVLEGADLLAALSAGDITGAAHAVAAIYECSIPVYGIGSSNEIVSYIEKGIVDTIAAYNGFNLGYLGIKSAVDAIEGRSPENEIILDYAMINLENLYTDSNQRLLFPFIQ